MQNIQTPQELKNRLDQKNPGDVLLDVRTPEEFEAGHIAGSTNFNISSPDFIDKIQQLDKAKNYILYCRSGGRSQMAAMIMAQNGLKTVYSKQGITDWQTAGFEVVK